jgi:hypothetical protein
MRYGAQIGRAQRGSVGVGEAGVGDIGLEVEDIGPIKIGGEDEFLVQPFGLGSEFIVPAIFRLGDDGLESLEPCLSGLMTKDRERGSLSTY